MTRLIDADAVYKILEACEINKDTYGSLLNEWDYGYNCGIERAENEIECAPTVDAVSVIRCKECKYYQRKSLTDDEWKWCMQWHNYTDENVYCSLAERKEDD